MPDIIKLLPDSVANQIAAGEVIQRPASVVKELMENAVDAGAGTVAVIIRDSGRTLIQVSDDGSGMSETDARLSFERHATSKISSASDLFAIVTKGFRGEALASIAAVAMVELRTRREGDETGTLVIINGSRVETQEPCSCQKGSVFSVKNLFYNVPARRKFLKSDNTELRHIINEFQKIVLAHPSIRFSLYNNDSEVYNLVPSNLRQRVISVFGKQINQDLINIETETSIVSIKGFIGKPESARRTYGEQFFFVNDRFMKHPYFHRAVAEAYQNILPPDAIPTYFIFMEADPSTIDINIHPTKTEIKFEDERAIWQILMASVREALGRFNIVPSIDFENEGIIEIPVKSQTGPFPKQPVVQINPNYNPFDGEGSFPEGRNISGIHGRDNTAGWQRIFSSLEKESSTQIPDGRTETGRRFLQIRNKYIVCPVKSGLMLIDQRKAHERILFEKFSDSLSLGNPVSQTELYEVTMNTDPAGWQVLKELEKDLRVLGFSLEFREPGTIIIRGRPSNILSPDPAMLLEAFIREFLSSGESPLRVEKERLASAMASASAIPYGKSLSQSEMEDLFDSLFACKAPNYSPGGKPVIVIIPLEDLDRRFRQS